MSLLEKIDNLLNKAMAQEAVEHTIQGVPKKDEDWKEKNKANSGTHPQNKGNPGGPRVEIDDGEEQGYKFAKEGGGQAPLARPESKKHEGGEKSVTSSNLKKNFGKDEDDKDKNHEKDESAEEEAKEHKKASSSSEAVYLDIDQFKAEIAKSVVEEVIALIEDKYADAFAKASQSEIIGTGLAASIEATLERVEDMEKSHNEYAETVEEYAGKMEVVEKVLSNITKALSVRKSVLRKSDIVKNDSMEGTSTMSKSEISSALLDMSIKGQGVDPQVVVRFETSGDINVIPENIRASLGL
jgi:hypothetical protein